MNFGVIYKTLRDSRWQLLCLPLLIVVFEMLFFRAIGEIHDSSGGMDLVRIPFVRRFLQTLLGADLLENLTATGVASLGFAHPIVYASTWTLLLTIGSRVIAGEIDRGTADLQFALPVSRAASYASHSIVMLAAVALTSVAPLIGAALAARVFPLWEPIDLGRLSLLITNLAALNLSICGITLLASAMSSRRGSPIAVLLALLLGSFLLNFLAQIWQPAKDVAFLGLLSYYKPLPIISRGVWPVYEMMVLVCIGVGSWFAGLACFSRRDIPAA
ncbi:MAG: ABC transporter permease subunit [Phycisphaerae bacterium]